MAKSEASKRAGLKFSQSLAGTLCAHKYYDKNRHVCLTRSKAAELKRKYGLTIEQVDQMIEAQAGLCSICCNPMSPGYDTCVDHDHVAGTVRGLLCHRCNLGIGNLHDDPLLLHGALQYLG